MKRSAFLLFFLPLLAFAAPQEGGEAGNGGQQTALEFATYGADLTALLDRSFRPGSPICHDETYADLCGLNVMNLRNVIRAARIIALPNLTQQDPATGRTVTYVALNFPQDQRMLISEEEWTKPSLCYVKKLPLVLHEYLGLLGLEVQNYRYSSLLSEWFRHNAADLRFDGCPELKNKGE